MAPSTQRLQPRLDPQRLKSRTQEIGRELFAATRRQHERLSVLNRWTAQVLSWCLSDPAVKSAVLRFIDVLPSLKTSREIIQHARDYFPTNELHLPAALRVGVEMARPGILTRGALAAVIKQMVEQVARQFIAPADAQGLSGTIRVLAERGVSCSLDVLGEQVLSDAEAQTYLTQCTELLQTHAAQLSLKPSALTPRFDPIAPERSIEDATGRLSLLLNLAAERHALINLDMEQYALRDLTLALAKRLLLDTKRRGGPSLGVVIQAYLRDSEEVLEELLAWLSMHECTVMMRLVKGAYWDAELAQAKRQHWPIPVYEEKVETDAAFERLTLRLLGAHPLVTTAIASHNIRSIAHAMVAAELMGLEKDQVEFQLLYGMGEAIQAAIVERGYPVRIYTPIGELIPGMAYLVRRLLENTANESFLRQDFSHEPLP